MPRADYSDIHEKARSIEDDLKRVRYVNRAIQIRYYGFWYYHWMKLLDFFNIKYEIR